MAKCKTICEDCGKVYMGGPASFFCPECGRKRTAEAARKNAIKRGLNKIGNDAYSEQRSIAKAMERQ